MESMMKGIISITISAIILANVFVSQVKATNRSYTCLNGSGFMTGTCSWTSSETVLWNLLTLLGIVGMVYGALGVFGIV